MISDIMLFNVKAGDLVKENKKEGNISSFEIEVSGDIDKSNIGYKILIVYVDIYLYDKGQLYTIATIHKFSCQMTETNIIKFKEDDYIGMTNTIQAAISQALLILMQKAGTLKLQLEPLPLPLFANIYKDVKEGVYSLWN